MAVLEDFVANRLKKFDTQRNDPNVHACSNMSPYTHFGQVSAHAVALYVKKHGKIHGASVANYIEESIIRRELSDNFCFYNANHDSIKGAWIHKPRPRRARARARAHARVFHLW